MELRCEGRLHGVYDAHAGTIEVKCPRRACGAESGVVVIHTIRLSDGTTIKTQKFRDPGRNDGIR